MLRRLGSRISVREEGELGDAPLRSLADGKVVRDDEYDVSECATSTNPIARAGLAFSRNDELLNRREHRQVLREIEPLSAVVTKPAGCARATSSGTVGDRAEDVRPVVGAERNEVGVLVLI